MLSSPDLFEYTGIKSLIIIIRWNVVCLLPSLPLVCASSRAFPSVPKGDTVDGFILVLRHMMSIFQVFSLRFAWTKPTGYTIRRGEELTQGRWYAKCVLEYCMIEV